MDATWTWTLELRNRLTARNYGALTKRVAEYRSMTDPGPVRK